MEIESLTKSQIVLLTLLVSFVTSIATGITTVALMDQAPPTITQTINRVVEHTVERVVPEQQSASAAGSVTHETIVVARADAIASAVAEASPSVVRISVDADKKPIALGVILAGGLIVTDAAVMSDSADYNARLSDGTVVPLTVATVSTDKQLVAFSAPTDVTGLTPVSVQRTVPNLGETLIALLGLGTARIADGIVTSVVPLSTAASSTEQTFESSIALGPLAAGSVFVSTDGALLGLYSSITDNILPSSSISKLRAKVTESVSEAAATSN